MQHRHGDCGAERRWYWPRHGLVATRTARIRPDLGRGGPPPQPKAQGRAQRPCTECSAASAHAMSSNDEITLPPILAQAFVSFDAAATGNRSPPRPLTRTSAGHAKRHQAKQPPPVAAAHSFNEYTEATHSCRAASAYKKSILHPSYECLRQIVRGNLHDAKPRDLPPPPAHTPHTPGLPESHAHARRQTPSCSARPARTARSRRHTAPNPVRVRPTPAGGGPNEASLRKVRVLPACAKAVPTPCRLHTRMPAQRPSFRLQNCN